MKPNMTDSISKLIAIFLLVILSITAAWWALNIVMPMFGMQPLTFMQTLAFMVLIVVARFITK
jgi:small-conductance mechanosensitive channel